MCYVGTPLVGIRGGASGVGACCYWLSYTSFIISYNVSFRFKTFLLICPGNSYSLCNRRVLFLVGDEKTTDHCKGGGGVEEGKGPLRSPSHHIQSKGEVGAVILSAAKDLCVARREILCCAQDDRTRRWMTERYAYPKTTRRLKNTLY